MGKRVLLADDSVTIQRAFAMVFGGQDLSITAARSFDEALTAARQSRPDLIIADVGLGTRSGYELCQAVKADAGLQHVPVYMFASNHNPFDEGKAKQAGADGHFLKPFESQGLIDAVTQALAKVATTAPVQGLTAGLAVPASGRKPAPTTEIEIGDDDDYGEFTIERTEAAAPAAVTRPATPPAPPAAPSRSTPAAPRPAVGAPIATPAREPTPSPGGLRPSLIPGARPQAAPQARPSAAPAAASPAARLTPPAPMPSVVPAAAPPPAAGARPVGGRTMMGIPAMAPPGGATGAAPQARPAPAAVTPTAAAPVGPPAATLPASAAALPSFTAPAAARPAPSASAREAVAAKLDQKIAAFSAKGPEYEAIAKLSREIIEQVVWEVVPEIAEVIIRQEVDRLAAARK